MLLAKPDSSNETVLLLVLFRKLRLCKLQNLARRHWHGFVTSEIYIRFHVIYGGSGKLIQPLQKSFSRFFHLEPLKQRYFSLFYTIVPYKAFTFSVFLMS